MSVQKHHGSLSSYIIGFVLSIALTLAAYFTVTENLVSGWTLMFILIELAVVQLMVQLFLFLHLGRENRPWWNLQMFLFAVLVVGIVVIGSIWIMKNLDYNTHEMKPQETNEYIFEEEQIRR